MNSIFVSLIYLFISCVILIMAKGAYIKLLEYNFYEEIKNKNYTALVPYCGFLLGCVAVLAGAFIGPDSQSLLWKEILYYVFYAVIGISLILLSCRIAEKAILNKFNNTNELIRDKNIGTAAVHFGIYLASGLIISACVMGDTLLNHGKWYGLCSTIFYYTFGMLFLVMFSRIHDRLTPYSIQGEIEKDNAAVGISFAGHIIAIGIILMRATIGDIGTFTQGLSAYFIDISAIILLLPSVRILLDKILVRDINITQEIKNGNIAAGLGEAFVIISFAVLIFFMVDIISLV